MCASRSLISLQVVGFFFKKKTAYEMRNSDWSSDVCSSDLNTTELFSGNVSLVNASLTYSAPGDDWSLAIGGNNVFNKRYIANGVNQLNGTGLLSAVPNRPSEYYATLRFKF